MPIDSKLLVVYDSAEVRQGFGIFQIHSGGEAR